MALASEDSFLTATNEGPGSPRATHRSRTAMSLSASLPVGGILSLPLKRMAWMSRLCSGLPGSAAGPRFPPARIDSRDSTENPFVCLLESWQRAQLFCSMGRTYFAKKDRSSALKICVDFCGAATAKVARVTSPKPPMSKHGRETCQLLEGSPGKQGSVGGAEYHWSKYLSRTPTHTKQNSHRRSILSDLCLRVNWVLC